MAESRAVALGDPRYLGYLASNSWNHGFPRYARRFYANYLSLPALPGTVDTRATSEPDIITRRIPTGEHGTWYAIVNLNYTARKVKLNLGARGAIRHAPTGTVLGTSPGSVEIGLEPFELMALHVR